MRHKIILTITNKQLTMNRLYSLPVELPLTILAVACLVLASCKKQPVKKCYTVTNVHVVSLTPDVYRITFVSGKDTVQLKTSSLYTVGYNTCTGYYFNVPQNLMP